MLQMQLSIGMIKHQNKEKEDGLKGRETFIGELGLNQEPKNKCMMIKMELKINENFKPKEKDINYIN